MNKLLIFSLFIMLTAAKCTHVRIDSAMGAADGNDATVALRGCRKPLEVGYNFCRVNNGASPSEIVELHIPKVKCKRDACAEYQWIRLDGSFGPSGGIRKGQTLVPFVLSEITGANEEINESHEGEYAVVVRLYFLGPDGEEFSTIAKGFFRLVVLDPMYAPVGCGDPNILWINKIDSCKLQTTSKYRSAKCGC